jgi:hypothetical protein
MPKPECGNALCDRPSWNCSIDSVKSGSMGTVQ